MCTKWHVTAYLHFGHICFHCSYGLLFICVLKSIPGHHDCYTFAITDRTSSAHLTVKRELAHPTDLPSVETRILARVAKTSFKGIFFAVSSAHARGTHKLHTQTQTLSPPASLPRGSLWLVHLSCPSEPCGRDSNNPLVFPLLWTVHHSRPSAGQTVVRQRLRLSCYRRTTVLASWGFRFLLREPETKCVPHRRCIPERTSKILFLMTESFYVFKSKTVCVSASRLR